MLLCTVVGSMGDLQDPKMEVLYHIRLYFVEISPYIGLTYGRYLQSIPGMAIVLGGRDKRNKLGVFIFPIYSLFNGELFGATN